MLLLSDCCIFMESVSWGGEVGGSGGGAGFQYTHLHIKTTLAQDSAEREGGGEGRAMKGALFPLYPSGLGRNGSL